MTDSNREAEIEFKKLEEISNSTEEIDIRDFEHEYPPFGVNQNKVIGSISLQYLDWCMGQPGLFRDFPEFMGKLKSYMSQQSIKRELELELGED